MGTVAPSSTDCGMVYESISSPKTPSVVRLKSLSMGVPVKPTNVACGMAARIFAARRPYWVRCASSTITTTLSASLRWPSGPAGAFSTSSNFWMVVMTVRPLFVRSSSRRRRVLFARSGLSTAACWKVFVICWSSCVRSVTTTMVGLRRAGERRSFVASQSIVSDLPGALRVPDDAAPLLRCAALQDALDAVAHGAVLLVARQLLHQPPALVLEHDEVAQDVEEDGGIEQAGDEPRLPLGRGAEAALELALGERLDRLPAGVGILGGAHGAEGGIGAAVGDAQQVRVEELGGAGAVPLRPGLLVATQLLDRLRPSRPPAAWATSLP